MGGQEGWTLARVGERLRAYRCYRMLTQKEVHYLSGLSSNMIISYEKGTRAAGLVNFLRYLAAIEIDPGYFFLRGPPQTLKELDCADALRLREKARECRKAQ